MDLKRIKHKIIDFIKKYRYVAIILIVGLLLMTLPTTQKKQGSVQQQISPEVKSEITLNESLSTILSRIDGAGEVQVMLSLASGEETVYQTDDHVVTSADTNTTQIDTVTITDADRNQTGLIRQINPPKYLGAIVVCEGADSSAVRLAIIDAVSKVTGLNTNQISVLKMK